MRTSAFRTMLVLALVTATLIFPAPAEAAGLQPPRTPAIPACGVRSNADIDFPSAAAPTGTYTVAIANQNSSAPIGLSHFRLVKGATEAQNKWFLLDGTNIRQYNGSFQLVATTSVPSGVSSFAVDAGGNFYVQPDIFTIRKLSPTGATVWSKATVGPSGGGVYSYFVNGQFRIGVVMRNQTSDVYDANGNRQAPNKVHGSNIHQNEVTKDIIAVQAGFVRVFSTDGQTQKFYVGTTLGPNDPGPYHFYVLSGADQLPDGRLVVSDNGHGLALYTADGLLLGQAKDDGPLGGGVTGVMARGVNIRYSDGKIFFGQAYGTTPGRNFSYMTESDFIAHSLRNPTTKLGVGAGPFTNAATNHFRDGVTPQVFLQFYPWWSQVGGSLQGTYGVRRLTGTSVDQPFPATPFSVSVKPDAITNIEVPISQRDPGFYEVDVKLSRNGVVIGADCLTFSIGMPGMKYSGSFNELSLTDEMGMKLYRLGIDFDQNIGSTPTTPLVFPPAQEQMIIAASQQAAAAGVTLEIQVATGSAKEKGLVSAGTWDDRVTELVNHYKPYVKNWEAWNEPNNTYSGNGAAFATNILNPFYDAVKAADPTAKVVGGGILGIDLGYYQAMHSAGAFNKMDILGVHPYTGHNRSFEEQGSVEALNALKAFLAGIGKANLPIWDTESGFWNSGTSSFYEQGKKNVRKSILYDSVGITHRANFYMSGAFQVEGLTWALVRGNTTPGSVAMSVYDTKIGDRQFQGFLPTGVPHAYAAKYGFAGQRHDRIVVWTEDFTVRARASVAGATSLVVTDEGGKSVSRPVIAGTVPLVLMGNPQYLDVPVGTDVSLEAREAYGPNVALGANGATASASSSAANNPPARAIDGKVTMGNRGNNGDGASVSNWIHKGTDANPTLTVTFPSVKTIDRVYVASQGLGSVQTGLRDYDLQLRRPDGTWVTTAKIRNQFSARTKLINIAPQAATAMRITNFSVNYSGYSYGFRPGFWPDLATTTADDVWAGQGVVYEFEAYEPGTIREVPAYQLATDKGSVLTFGDVTSHGSLDAVRLAQPIVGTTLTPAGDGYWMVARDGGVFSFGDAQFFGSTGNIRLNQPIVGMASTPSGNGYWMVASDGGVFAYGDAQFYGSTGNIKLNRPIVGIAPTPSGHGYWMVADDGGVFAYGDAHFFGSTGNIKLNRPIVAMTSTSSGRGYWMVADDGGVFAYGDARFFGSTGNIRLAQPITGIASTPSGNGYWMVARDGGIFNYGDAAFVGSAGGQPLNGVVVGITGRSSRSR